jgi:hypothetical protein
MRYMLLTYNPPGGREIWAANDRDERRAEEDEYVRLVEAMRERKAYIAELDLLDPQEGRHVRLVTLHVGDERLGRLVCQKRLDRLLGPCVDDAVEEHAGSVTPRLRQKIRPT